MTLKHKLTIGFLSVAFIVAVMGAIVVGLTSTIEEDIQEIAQSNIGEVQGSIDIAFHMATISADLNAYLLASQTGANAESDGIRHRILADLARVEASIGRLREATETGEELAESDEKEGEAAELLKIEKLKALLNEYHDFIAKMFATADSLGPAEAREYFLTDNPKLEARIREKAEHLFSDAMEEIREEVDEVAESVDHSVVIILAMTLGAFGLALVIGRLVSIPLSRRIHQLVEATIELQNGNWDLQIPTPPAGDELNHLARAYNDLSASLKTSTASIDDLNHQVRERRQAEAALRKAHDELELRVRQRTLEFENAKIHAEKASLAKTEFLANMSHELRTPLNHIIGFTEILIDKHFGELNETQTDYLNDVMGSSRHLLSLINDILDISKVEAGKLELAPGEVALQALVDNSLIMVKEKAHKQAIKLSQRIDPKIDTILADERKLKQILYNLLSNAVKFTREGGRVTIAAELRKSKRADLAMPESGTESGILISVRDTGIGLDEQDIERVFNPFEQVESSKSRQYQGTGLGLALTKNLVELHGGRIWAESKGLDRGAVFSFILPLELPH